MWCSLFIIKWTLFLSHLGVNNDCHGWICWSFVAKELQLIYGRSDLPEHLIYTLTKELFSLIRERRGCAVCSAPCQFFFELLVTFNKNIQANSFICKWICYWNFYLVSRQPFYGLELKPFLTEDFEEPFSFQATSLNCLYVSCVWGNILMGYDPNETEIFDLAHWSKWLFGQAVI